MRIRTRRTVSNRKGLLACLVVGSILVLGGAVRAADGDSQARSRPSGWADSLRSSPHGGDVVNRETCSLCHPRGRDGYSDGWEQRVTATCLACHDGRGLTSAGSDSGALDGRPVAGHETALARSSRTPYGLSFPLSGHVVGPDTGPGSPPGKPEGSQCTSCHTFHGEPGLVVNGWTRRDEGRRIGWQDPDTGEWSRRNLHYDDASGTWQVCDTRNEDCRPAEVLDAGGRLVPLYGYKLLTTRPGDTSAQVRSYGTQSDSRDKVAWCGACHPSQVDRSLGGTLQNHPIACDACHGDPEDGSSTGFPHTSALSTLLRRYPDELCIGCHVSGSLP